MSGADWYDDDAFWETFGPAMFTEDAWERAAKEVDGLLTLAEVEAGAAILDMGCGPGRHSLELARRGYRVTGVDRTRIYLDEARRRAVDEGLEIELIQGDNRDFERDGAFDFALSLFTSVGYYETEEENRAVLEVLGRCLKPGGKLVIELMSKEVLARTFSPRDWRELEDGTLMLEDRKAVEDWSRIEATWTVIPPEGARVVHQFTHWLYSAREIRRLLLDAGFSRVSCFGGLDGRPYDHSAERLVVVAIK
jgi:SAM-dependent methyltransferase